MGSSKPAFVEGIRTNRTGRRTYTVEFKSAVVRECSEPGVSLSAVAMAHRINANLVRRWVRHLDVPEPKPTAATLLPVTVAADAAMAGGDFAKRSEFERSHDRARSLRRAHSFARWRRCGVAAQRARRAGAAMIGLPAGPGCGSRRA